MGTIFYNNIPLSTINPYTLLFHEHSLNIQFNSTPQFKTFPIMLFSFIFLYALTTFIYIILTSHNYSEGILITTTVIISLLCLIVSLCIKFKKNCFTIKNERSVELLLLTVIFILFTLINQILCAHLKHFTNNYNSLIETIFVNLEIICKCLWTVLNVNEFVYVFFGTVINCVIIVPYNYMRLLTLFSLIIVFSAQGLYAYFFTKLRKEMFIQKKMNVDMKTNDILGLGYATMYMNVNDNNKVKKLNENEILNDSIVNENSYLKNMFFNACEDKENLFSLLNEVEDINDEIKKCLLYCLNYQTEQIQLIEKEKINQNNRNSFKLSISNSGNTLIQTTNENNNNNNSSFNKAHHKIENSLTNLVSKVSHNFQLISNNKYDNVKTGKSRTFEPQTTKKFGCSSGTATFNSQIPSIDIHPKYTFQLPEFHKRKNKQLISDDDGDKGIPIPVQETKENQINEINTKKLNESINDSYFLLPLLFSTGLNRFLKQDEFIYLGRKRINTKSLKTQPSDNTMSNIKSSNKQLPIIKNSFDLSLSSPTDFSFYKIYFRFNAILSGLEFLFLDESKNQFENLFKSYSRQVSMYLHDFKNPLTAINEKIIDYKEIFQSILLESKDEQMGMFKFGKSELDDMVFLSITSEDCLGMIKSYEDFSKAFANNNETMTLNLSSFYLSEITTYLSEWINIKNQRTHQEIEFIVNDLTLSKRFKLYTDKLKLKQILINIISNSYKFTKNGDITLTITREIINSKQYTKFHIRDTGDGMDKFTMKNLFNPFFSKNGGNKNKEGCGLGLVLSMRMSKNLGLPIEVESEENKGTSMWFYIEEKEKEKIEGSENCNKTNNEEYEDNIDDNIDDNNNNNNIGTLINSVVGEDEDDLSLTKKKNALYNNNLNKSESNLDFIPLTFNDSKAQNTTIVEDSSFCKSKNNLNSSLNTKEKPNRYKKLNSFQSTETILCDNIMKIDPKEKGFVQAPKMFISMSPQRPTIMNLILPDSHKLSSSIQNSFNYSSIKKNLKRHKFQSSFEDTAFFGLSIIKQEITMSILGKPPLSDLNLISSQNNIANNNNNYPNFPFHNSTTSQLFLNNNYTLNTTNNNQSVNNVNLGFGFCKKGTVSTLWTKNFCKTKGSSNFFNVKSLLSKKDTKTTNAFSDLGVKREKMISVLLVDDDENFQRAHKRLLEKLNIDEVVSVYDGIDLMMMFLRNELTSFDLIILDNFMTYLHGTEVVKIIKFMKDSEMGSKGGFDFTVLNKIFISTGAQDIAMSSLEQFDTVDFIAKPICKNDMENIIRKVLAGVK